MKLNWGKPYCSNNEEIDIEKSPYPLTWYNEDITDNDGNVIQPGREVNIPLVHFLNWGKYQIFKGDGKMVLRKYYGKKFRDCVNTIWIDDSIFDSIAEDMGYTIKTVIKEDL